MKTFLRLMLFLAVCLTSACATMPTSEQVANADYGPYPSNYQEIIKSYMENRLFDPYSAVYSNWLGPSKGYIFDKIDGAFFGYRVCVNINAKNKMGGYVGQEQLFFMINQAHIIATESFTQPRGLCNFGYEPPDTEKPKPPQKTESRLDGLNILNIAP